MFFPLGAWTTAFHLRGSPRFLNYQCRPVVSYLSIEHVIDSVYVSKKKATRKGLVIRALHLKSWSHLWVVVKSRKLASSDGRRRLKIGKDEQSPVPFSKAKTYRVANIAQPVLIRDKHTLDRRTRVKRESNEEKASQRRFERRLIKVDRSSKVNRLRVKSEQRLNYQNCRFGRIIEIQKNMARCHVKEEYS
jgi:hypothetical protein